MEDDNCWVYRGFVLMSEPKPRGPGYTVTAAVMPAGRPEEAVLADSPDDVVLISAEAAVAYGRAWGTEFVDALLGAVKAPD